MAKIIEATSSHVEPQPLERQIGIFEQVKGIGDLVFGDGSLTYNDPQLYDAIEQGPLFRRLNMARGLVDVVEKYAALPQNSRILEIAAGTGIVTRELAERGYRVQPVDISARALEGLQRRTQGLSNVEQPIQANMNMSWPIPDASVKAVIEVRASRYIQNFQNWLQEAKRVLEPEGKLILPVYWLDVPLWKMHSRRGMKQPTLTRNLIVELQTAGFEVEKVVRYSDIIKQFGSDRRIPRYYFPTTIIARKPTSERINK